MKTLKNLLIGVLVGLLAGAPAVYALTASSYSADETGDSASSLSYTWLGDSDTGIFSVGANELGIATGGSQRFAVNATRVNLDVPLYFADGTAAAPSVTFETDTDLGLSRVGADNLGISAVTVTLDAGENKTIDIAASTGVGHTLALVGGGGAAANAGGPISVTGGVPASGNGAGGAASITGGAGSGTAAGGAVSVTGGAGGATNTTGGAVEIDGGVDGGTGTGGGVDIDAGVGDTQGLLRLGSESAALISIGDVDQVSFRGIRSVQVTENPASVATVVCAEQVLTTDATDLATGDIVLGTGVYVTGNAVGTGLIHVSSATEVTVTFCNPTAGALTPSATDFTIFVIDAA